ncbi:uncharacterized protein VP01_3988g3 [Puccinia sorghi]|uniref:Uncharacterized protein n=1 Tax=Puccinia sorghi TaxID=27349 RepID=A0A0L6US91_9BASI|nr:uncharacterized protein VP01_3988g3 [Puccinia sorghi]
MGYEAVIADSGNPLWNVILAEMQRDVVRELAHNKKLRQTKDGKGLIPKLDKLKDYMEASLSILALGLSTIATKKLATKWERWSPQEMHDGEDNKDNHIGFRLRQSQRLGDKEKEKPGQRKLRELVDSGAELKIMPEDVAV